MELKSQGAMVSHRWLQKQVDIKKTKESFENFKDPHDVLLFNSRQVDRHASSSDRPRNTFRILLNSWELERGDSRKSTKERWKSVAVLWTLDKRESKRKEESLLTSNDPSLITWNDLNAISNLNDSAYYSSRSPHSRSSGSQALEDVWDWYSKRGIQLTRRRIELVCLREIREGTERKGEADKRAWRRGRIGLELEEGTKDIGGSAYQEDQSLLT